MLLVHFFLSKVVVILTNKLFYNPHIYFLELFKKKTIFHAFVKVLCHPGGSKSMFSADILGDVGRTD